MAKILIIPDVHGRDFWIEPCSHINEFDKIIFLGDYVDCYPEEGITNLETLHNFEKIIEFANSNSKTILLLGNHDLQYISSVFYRTCGGSRFCRKYYYKYQGLFKSAKFQIAYEIDNILFTHAGYIKKWGNLYNLSDTAESLNTLLDNPQPLTVVSRYRGGWNAVGSCVWSDVSEKIDFDKNKNLLNITGTNKYQVFGHTMQLDEHAWLDTHTFKLEEHLKYPLINKYWAMLDNGKAYMLDTETKNIQEYD